MFDGCGSVERFAQAADIPLDGAYALLANGRTRRTLTVLSAFDPPVTLERLVEGVARLERDEPDERTTSEVRIDLVHVVLPRLEDAGLLAFDPATGNVTVEKRLETDSERFEGVNVGSATSR